MSETPKKRKPLIPRKGDELHSAAEKGLPLTQKELAAVMLCSVDSISRWTKQGMPCFYNGIVQHHARGARPRYIYKDCLKWWKSRNGEGDEA